MTICRSTLYPPRFQENIVDKNKGKGKGRQKIAIPLWRSPLRTHIFGVLLFKYFKSFIPVFFFLLPSIVFRRILFLLSFISTILSYSCKWRRTISTIGNGIEMLGTSQYTVILRTLPFKMPLLPCVAQPISFHSFGSHLRFGMWMLLTALTLCVVGA